MDVDQSTLGINVADSQVEPFTQPQPQGVNGPKEGSHALGCGSIDDGVHLVDGQHFGEGVDVLQLEHREDVPVAFASDAIEELNARERDTQGAVGEVSFVFQMQEELSDLSFGDFIGLFFGELSELSDGTEVAVMGARRFAGQVQIIAHALEEFLPKELGGGLGSGFSVRLSHVRNLYKRGIAAFPMNAVSVKIAHVFPRRASGLLEQDDARESRSRAFGQLQISRRDRVIADVRGNNPGTAERLVGRTVLFLGSWALLESVGCRKHSSLGFSHVQAVCLLNGDSRLEENEPGGQNRPVVIVVGFDQIVPRS
jgi:hypothetical protein